MKIKRVIAMLLVLVMCVSLFSTTAFAYTGDTDTEPTEAVVEQTDELPYSFTINENGSIVLSFDGKETFAPYQQVHLIYVVAVRAVFPPGSLGLIIQKAVADHQIYRFAVQGNGHGLGIFSHGYPPKYFGFCLKWSSFLV